MYKNIIYRIGCFIHDTIGILLYNRKQITQKIKGRLSADDVYNFLNTGKRTYCIINILMDQTIVHFVLIRLNEQKDLVIMDPGTGENRIYPLSEFRNKFQKLLFGYTIVIDP